MRRGILAVTSLAAAALVPLWWSWRKWPDFLVDFGRELYLPWQLVSGKVLYRDITYLNGPLSPYVNATAFGLFGVSYETLIAVNLVVVAVVAMLVWLLAAETGSHLAAHIATGAFLTVFAFGQYVGIGNYNYMSPYYHEATHGILLALAAVWLMGRSLRRASHRELAAAALLIGLVLLTKVEIALAAVASAAAFVMLERRGRRMRAAAMLLLIAPLPYVAAVALFSRTMPLREAMLACLGSLRFVLATDIARNEFYTRVMGLDDPFRHIGALLAATVIASAAVLLMLALARTVAVSADACVRTASGAGLAVIALCAFLLTPDRAALVLPAAAIGAVIGSYRARRPALVLFAVFALVCLAKMGLSPRISHYGFYLAMPAFAVSAAMLLSIVPERFTGSAKGRQAFTFAALAFVAVFAVRCLMLSRGWYSLKTAPLGPGGDAIVTYDERIDPRTPVIARSGRWIAQNLAPDDTLLTVPEGLMFNYLTRHANGTPYLTFTLPELQAFGEQTMLRELRAAGPDYVALVHRDAAEYGVQMWGRDPRYGMSIQQWIDANYTPVARFGAEPFRHPDHFGIEILKRRVQQ
jgi:Dolichyl-phosphate-mannose-protein mannosyltransferase